MQRPGNRADMVMGLLFALLGVAVFWFALGYRNMPGMPVGAGLFPRIVGGGMVVFGLVLVAQGWLARSGAVQPEGITVESLTGETVPDDAFERGGLDWSYVGLLLGAIIATIFLMPILGFLLTGFVFCVFIVRLSGGGWIGALIFSPIMTYLTYLAFYNGFRVPLPRGILG